MKHRYYVTVETELPSCDTLQPQPASNHVPNSALRLNVIGWQLIIQLTAAQTAELIGGSRGNENLIGLTKGGYANEAVWFKLEYANKTLKLNWHLN